MPVIVSFLVIPIPIELNLILADRIFSFKPFQVFLGQTFRVDFLFS